MPPGTLLTYLDINKDDSIITVTENALADANFILPYLGKNCLENTQNICLLATHNGIEHYRNVFKRLGVDLDGKIEAGSMEVIDLLSRIEEILFEGGDTKFPNEDFMETLFTEISSKLQKLTQANRTCLMIDDLSHFLDLQINLKNILSFANRCINLTGNGDVRVVIVTHVSDEESRILGKSLDYVADVVLDVRNLSTGRSHNVTGVIKVTRNLKSCEYHYKAGDKGIMTFFPGESLNFLYR